MGREGGQQHLLNSILNKTNKPGMDVGYRYIFESDHVLKQVNPFSKETVRCAFKNKELNKEKCMEP